MTRYRILVVDDHPALRHGLAQLIDREPDFETMGQAGDRNEALTAVARQRPDFVILDLALNGRPEKGIDLITEILALVEKVPILIYSMHDESIYAERALRAGARGYLMKQTPVRQVIEAIRGILKNGVYLSPEMTFRLLMDQVGGAAESSGPPSPRECLTEREQEVLRLMGIGSPPREIADKLCLSIKTVESHRTNMRKKLGLANAAELTKFAVAWVRQTG
jgi:DNA-binding NarL/FixJ family response regulator